jgi:hypothetical protein
MNLPLEFQNASSSGFQSEIQVGFLSRITNSLSSLVGLKAQGRAPGRPPVGGVANSDDWFQRTASVASQQSYSSSMPNRARKKIQTFLMA